MKIEYRQAVIEDAELLVNIYNASFTTIMYDMVHARDMDRPKK